MLVYDEPASGLDPATTHTVVEFTRELAEEGKTVLFSAHDLYHVESVCDRVAILHEGRIAAKGPIEEIRDRHGTVEYRVFTDVPLEATTAIGDRWVADVSSMDAVEGLRERAHDAGGAVVDIRTRESNLEELFLEVTADGDG